MTQQVGPGPTETLGKVLSCASLNEAKIIEDERPRSIYLCKQAKPSKVDLKDAFQDKIPELGLDSCLAGRLLCFSETGNDF